MIKINNEDLINEIKLVQEAQNNNPLAFKEILKRHKSSVYFMIYQIVNDKLNAEDLTMEVFAKVFKDIKKFSPTYRLSTWIFKVGKNHTIDYLRSEQRRPKSFDINIPEDRVQNFISYSPEEEYIGKEREILIKNLINRLKDQNKKIIKLRINGYSYKEISENLGISMDLVKSSILRTRKKIKKEILNTK